jgi:hypothetical protein
VIGGQRLIPANLNEALSTLGGASYPVGTDVVPVGMRAVRGG